MWEALTKDSFATSDKGEVFYPYNVLGSLAAWYGVLLANEDSHRCLHRSRLFYLCSLLATIVTAYELRMTFNPVYLLAACLVVPHALYLPLVSWSTQSMARLRPWDSFRLYTSRLGRSNLVQLCFLCTVITFISVVSALSAASAISTMLGWGFAIVFGTNAGFAGLSLRILSEANGASGPGTTSGAH